ncbi:MAG: glycoside hydrolase family 3 N-terminal domain-containing protein [Ferruginibacter sp.]
MQLSLRKMMKRLVAGEVCDATKAGLKNNSRAHKIFYTAVVSLLLVSSAGLAQNTAQNWVDSVYNSLSKDQRIAQLMVVRTSTYDSKTKKAIFLDKEAGALISKYNVGGICLFQGNPVRQAEMVNSLQSMAKTPLMVCIDGEWGLGMRMIDSVLPLPKQMMLGAMKDATIVYRYGQVVAEQCRRMGIQVNYAPVVDVNNNPNNPVINDRSFGEDKYKVADFGVAYMKGMQDNGVMACAKHFPGHGDVSVDSHYDLPVINKSAAELDSLELYPFRKIFEAGVGSVMIAHLYIPSIDTTANRATSLSPKNINGLLRKTIGYQGLTFTDALEMQGVKKFFPDGEASVQSIIAGNDMLCLPGDVPLSIEKIKKAIKQKKLSWTDIEIHCKKVLMAKYQYGLASLQPVNTTNLTADLNSKVPEIRKLVAENAITLLARKEDAFFPLGEKDNNKPGDVAYVAVGINRINDFGRRMDADYKAAVFYFDYSKTDADAGELILKLKEKYKRIIIGVHNTSRSPATNFGLSEAAVNLVNRLQQETSSMIFLFANAYAAKNFCSAKNLALCYEDDAITQNTAAEMLKGNLTFKGTLPVTVCENFKYGFGESTSSLYDPVPDPLNPTPGFDAAKMMAIDSIAEDAIAKWAIPGCRVMVVKDGKISYNKSFGFYDHYKKQPVNRESVYDMASVTKICATTIAVMKLYEDGKLDLKKNLGHYLGWVKGSDKEYLKIEDMLLHQAGLVAFIPFYKETLDSSGAPLDSIYFTSWRDKFPVKVAQNLYMREDWRDTMFSRILKSPLGPWSKYVYSDNDFIFLGKIVEAITHKSLERYVEDEFYKPMGLTSIGFRPQQRMPAMRIVPTEEEKIFRKQVLRGDVHDPGAAMFGGVSGHAGLFSNAYDIAAVMQMLLDGGSYNGRKYLGKETIGLFTDYHSDFSRRGYGFDKPEKDNYKRDEPYPAALPSSKTFGHTGFTGTCAWADPQYNIIYVFLSNRVNPVENRALLRMNVRGKIHDAIYKAMLR